jgi:hypothetical protein
MGWWLHLTRLQKLTAVLIVLGGAGSLTAVAVNIQQSQWGLALAWSTVLVGLVILWTAVDAIEYFREQNHLFGGSWILVIFVRIAVTITIVVVIVTASRVIALIFGPQIALTILGGLMFVWLLLIPRLMKTEFQKHEGRE